MDIFAYTSDKDFEIAREYLYFILDKAETTADDCKECYEEYLRLYEEEPDTEYKKENALNHDLLMNCAAKSEKLEIVKYFHSVGIPLTETMMERAAARDCVEIMEYCMQNGIPWRMRVCEKAAKYGCVNALRFAREHGCPWNVNYVLDNACHYISHACILYALQNGGKWTSRVCSLHANRCFLSEVYKLCKYATPGELEANLEDICKNIQKPTIYFREDEKEKILSCIKTREEREFYFGAVEKYESLKEYPIGMIVRTKQEEIKLYKEYSMRTCGGKIVEDVLKHVLWEYF